MLRRRGQFASDPALRHAVPRMTAAGLAMGAVLVAMQYAPSPFAGGHGMRWLGLGVLVATGAACYGMAGQMLGAFDGRMVAARLLRPRGG